MATGAPSQATENGSIVSKPEPFIVSCKFPEPAVADDGLRLERYGRGTPIGRKPVPLKSVVLIEVPGQLKIGVCQCLSTKGGISKSAYRKMFPLRSVSLFVILKPHFT